MSTRATVTITADEDRQKVATWARNVEPGTVVTFRKKSRSTEQSAKMWAMLHEVAEQVEWYGQKIDAEDWKDMFTASLRHARVVPGIDKGTFVPLGMHTSTMTIEEMTNLIELIYAFGAEHSVIFKEPKESEPAAAPPSAPAEAGDARPIPSPDAADGASDPPPASPSAATLSDADWLKTAARMLWAATNVGGNTDANLGILNAQRLAVGDLCPTEAEQTVKEKAGSIYRQCKAAVLSEVEKPKALKFIANMAGVEPADLGGSNG